MKIKFGSFVKKMSEELNEKSIPESQEFEQIPNEIADAIVGGYKQATNTSCNCDTGGATNTSCNCSSGGTNTSCNCSA